MKTTMNVTDRVRLCLIPLRVYEIVGTSQWEYLMSWSFREANVKSLSLFGTYFRDLIASLFATFLVKLFPFLTFFWHIF
jgi:hypothetical protein